MPSEQVIGTSDGTCSDTSVACNVYSTRGQMSQSTVDGETDTGHVGTGAILALAFGTQPYIYETGLVH